MPGLSGNDPRVTGSLGGTSMVDDEAFTASASSFVPVGGIVTADSVDSGDGGAFAMLANRQQKVTLYTAAGAELTTIVVDTEFPAAAALANATANPTVPGVGSYPMIFNGATWDRVYSANSFGDNESGANAPASSVLLYDGATYDRLRGTAADGALVDLGANNDVTITSTVAATFDHGSNRDVDTAAEQLTASSIPAKFGVTVLSAIANTGVIYVGNADETADTTDATDGFPLQPGDSIKLRVNNANLVYVMASVVNQKVYWLVD